MRLGFYAAVCAALATVAVLSASSPAADGAAGRYFVAGKLPANITPLADYGDRVLVNLTAGQAAQLKAAGLDVEPLADATLLRLNRVTIDTSAAVPAVPRGLASPPSPTSWVVQFVGPPAEGWLASLTKTGSRLVAHGYVPEHGWLVRAESPAIRRALTLPFVQAAVPFHPAYRISPRLDALSGALEVRVFLFDDVDLGAWAAKIAGLGATELGRIDDKDVKMLRLSTNAGLVSTLARLDAVQWIEPALELKLLNDRAADTMNVRPVWTGLNGVPGLEGQGEVVAVADTGLDNGNVATIHPDFLGRVKQLQAWGRPGPGGDILNGDASDAPLDSGGEHGAGGHGTHTAGSVVGNGAAWAGLNLTGCTASCVLTTPPKGMAPQAELVFQSISGPAAQLGSLSGVPEDPGVLYGAAYDQGARVHSNSYGSSAAGAYDGQAFLLDRFMETHPDMLITFSAGNSGTDSVPAPDGIIDFGSIGSPATAKDTLAVGASEDNRGAGFTSGRLLGIDQGDVPLYSSYAVFLNAAAPPIVNDLMSNNEEGMVAFSSRGPTQDGRIKPEVVGIGTHVLSTRSRLITTASDDVEFHYWSLPQHASSVGQPSQGDYPASTNAYYGFNGGTSMSNPLVAGTGALVRQYLRTRRGLSAPSAALIKAMMTAGAYELQGQYDPVHPDVTARPDNNEGWGRVDVAATVAPAAPTKIAVFDDPVGLRTGARAGYPLAVSQAGLPLRVQLAWTDVAGNLVAAKSLVNDLDLILKAPDGTIYRGNRFGARAGGTTPSTANPADGNHVDNLEGITVPSAAAGNWTVEIRGFTVPAAPQKYALVVRGALAGTPSGAIHFDALRYRAGGRPAQLVVNDPARTTNTVTAKVTSETTPAGVVVTLTEDPNAEGVFTGSLAIGSTLPVSHEDHLVAKYKDASGKIAVGKSNVDNVVPYIDHATLAGVTPFGASIAFRTHQEAAGSVDLGATPASFGTTVTDPALVRQRTVNVLGLDGAKRYYYRLRATDDAGNVGTDDNKGRLYTLRTSRSVVEYTYDAEAAAGWTHAVNPDNAAAGPDEWHLTTRADAVHGGTSAWLFGPEDPNANHGANADAFLDSPAINRTAAQWATAEFWANYDTEKGFDGVNVLGSDDGGATYRLLPLVSIGPASGLELDSAQIDGNSGGYRLLTFDISSFSGPTFRLRLQFTSDSGVEKGGFAFDDLTVKSSESAPVTATFGAASAASAAVTDGFVNVGTLTLTPGRDWVRLETLVLTRTGTASDADVPEVRVTVPGRAPVVVRFTSGKAAVRALTLDSSSASPVGALIEIRVAGGGGSGRTAGITAVAKGSALAPPDTVTGANGVFAPKAL